MLHKLEDLLDGCTVRATDGDLGSVSDAYFDDERWGMRYLIVNTGTWLADRRVLISPMFIRSFDLANRRVEVNLTRAQVEGSPDMETDKPVSRLREMEYYGYYGSSYYWTGPMMWGDVASPEAMLPPPPEIAREAARRREAERERSDPHLRSCSEVTGYHIAATDGDLGHLDDFVFDDADWAIRYIEVDTSNWWPAKHVVISPQWIERVSWSERKVHVAMTKESIKAGPSYEHMHPLSRDYETSLHRYYGRSAYWE